MNLFSPSDLLQLVLLLVCGVGFYRAAEVDDAPRFLWAGASMGVFAFTWLYLRQGVIGNLVGQAAVLGGIAVVRALLTLRSPPP